jgi:hypothetical protein
MIQTEQKIDTNELQLVENFTEQFINADKSIEDFHNKAVVRSNDRLKECLVMGKAAEQAFCNMYNGVANLEPNYEIYHGRSKDDGGKDVLGTEIDLDIKATLPRSKWLLIDKKHLKDNTLYVIALQRGVDVFKFAGYIRGKDLKDADGQPWFEYKPGDKLYNMNWIHHSKFPNCEYKSELYDGSAVDRISVRMNGHMIGYPIEYLKTNWALLGKALSIY